jgi:hypothetical protein
MKKLILLIIFSVICTSVAAVPNNFLKKPVNTVNTLKVFNNIIGPALSKCEAKCQNAFRSCMNQPAPVSWADCYGEYTMCLFGGFGDDEGCNPN